MNKSGDLFLVPGFSTSNIQEIDAGNLQELLVRCTDYCMLVDGHPPRPTSALSMVSERPKGWSLEDKLLVGIFKGEEKMIGVLDALRNYPAQDDWWIGLLLIDPEYRSHGLGRLILQFFENWLSLQGAKRILLGVVEQNERALKFWQSLGFEQVERQPPRKFGNLTHVVITMVHVLHKVEND